MKVNLEEYGRHFTDWWKGLQPAWRPRPSGGLSREPPPSEQWASLKKGGSAGLYVVVMALSWWVKSSTVANLEEHAADMWYLVDDVSWVLGLFASSQATGKNGKRRQFAAHDSMAPLKKSYVFNSLFYLV